VSGSSSCGGGPGFRVLVAVLVVLAYVGSWWITNVVVESD